MSEEQLPTNPPSGPPTEPDAAALSPLIAEEALKLVQRAARGNGLQAAAITLESLEGTVVSFTAESHFEIQTKVSEKTVNGKAQGEAVGSEEELRHTVARAVDAASKNPEVRAMAEQILKKRPDLGYGCDGLVLPLPKLQRHFVVHVGCAPCEKRGSIPCLTCKGTRQELCKQCHGSRDMVCPVCRGQQYVPGGSNGKRQQCSRCYGKGRTGCTQCNQTGHIPCHSCKAAGTTACQHCHGTGWVSLVAHLEIAATTRFTVPLADLPADLATLIDGLGAELITDKHAKVTLLPPGPKEEHGEGFTIAYQIELPWGNAAFKIGETRIEAHIFGNNPAITHAPPFLETALAPGLAVLARAARGEGDVAEQIKKAVRYRAIGECLMAVLRSSPKKAREWLHQKYPFGISSDAIDNMISQSDAALIQVTRRPRLIGLLGGLGGAALLYALYFAGPLRGWLAPYLTAMPAALLADLAVLGAGGMVTAVAIQLMAGRSLQTVLQRLMPKRRKGVPAKLMPKAGKTGLIGYGGAALLYVMILLGALQGGAAAPLWFTAIFGG